MTPVSLKTVGRFGLVLAAVALFSGCGGRRPIQEAPRNGGDVVTSADGIPIAYEAHGEGTTALVFVHGWSCDRGYWAGQTQPFSRRYRVVAVDLAGHGASGLGRSAWTMEAFGGTWRPAWRSSASSASSSSATRWGAT